MKQNLVKVFFSKDTNYFRVVIKWTHVANRTILVWKSTKFR